MNPQTDKANGHFPSILAPLLLALCLATPAASAAVHASLDRSKVVSGDTVLLTIETDGDDKGAQPDLSVLNKNFTVLGTSSSRQIQIINGRRSDKHQWQVELEPETTGVIAIPSIPVGASNTKALVLNVSPAGTNAPDTGDGGPVFMQSEIKPASKSIYVQQQLQYTLRMYYRVPLIEGAIEDPQSDDAIVERLGKDSQYQTTLNGQPYQVLQRSYAIFPQKSGSLTLSPARFSGRMMASSGGASVQGRMDALMNQFMGGANPFNNGFFNSGNLLDAAGKHVRVNSRPVNLDVKPAPANYRGKNWLPSAQLTLTDDWDTTTPDFKVGEPVTRTITLKAKGLEAAQLPELDFPEVAGLHEYPEKAVTQNQTDGDWIVGTSKRSFAFVPSKAGTITLPELHVDWWDTQAGKLRTASLPARKITVAAGSGAPSNSAATPVPAKPAADANIHSASPADNDTAKQPGPPRKTWPWVASALAALLAIALFIGWALLRKRRARPGRPNPDEVRTPPQASAPNPAARECRRELQTACTQNNPQASARALLQWAAVEWPQHPPRSLRAVAKMADAGYAEIAQLERALYAAGDPAEWHGAALWQAFKDGLARPGKQQPNAAAGLAPLYPQWDAGHS